MSHEPVNPTPPLILIRDSGLLDSILELSDLLLVALDAAGHIRLFNRACERATGFSATEVIGRSIYSTLIPAEESESVRAMADALLATGESNTSLSRWLTQAGDQRLIQWRNAAITDGNGRVELIIGSGIDITDLDHSRHREADRHRLNKALLAHATEGIVMVDADARIVSVNPAAERILGEQSANLLGQTIGHWLPDLDPTFADGRLGQMLATGEFGRHDLTVTRTDGSRIELQLTIARVDEHDHRCYLGFLQDVTERKRLENQIRIHLLELAHLDRLSALSELTAGLAHEISQPLTAVRSNAQACLALLRSPGSNLVEIEHALTRIVRQTTHAGEIITQLRAFLHRGEAAEREVVSVAELIDDVLHLLGHELQQADVTLLRRHCDPPCSIFVNRVQAEQVLANLIKNACDAMASASERTLTLSGARGEHGCEIHIADTGSGIPPEHLNRIFDPFFTTKPNSLGQGLSISRSIVEHHGGTLSVENRPAGGTLFRLRFPLVEDSGGCHACPT